ncbi:hypothetical protein [Frankia sp. CcWB2]
MGRPVSLIVRHDGPSWSAWSPQCPGLAMAQPSAAELRAALPDVLAWYFGEDTDTDAQIHVERRLCGGVVVRIAQDAQLWERQLVADRLGEALAAGDQAARLRAAPGNAAGEVIYVCALQSDRVSWLTGQLEDENDAVVAILPVAETMLWTMRFGAAHSGAGESVQPPAYRPETTFSEVMRTFAGPLQHLRA